jgi:anthranilate phosphoribosyltransferase
MPSKRRVPSQEESVVAREHVEALLTGFLDGEVRREELDAAITALRDRYVQLQEELAVVRGMR